jgi:ADP-ribose pyrophosphatase
MDKPPFNANDITIEHRETAFRGFFRIEKFRLRHRLFDGSWGKPLVRELFARGDSVGVLLYDPLRDSVALAQQFRIGCLDNEHGAWVWEVVAGMVKPGEDCTDVAVREVAEETGLQIHAGQLLPIARYYSSPGGTDERLQLYCALCDLPPAVEGVFGLAEEGEDIRIRTFATDEAFGAMLAGTINNAATLIALQWLQLNRGKLRQNQAVSASP